MMQLQRLFLLLLALLALAVPAQARCHNNCNMHGKCGLSSVCECFSGWEGNECNRRVCPKGPVLADVASAVDVSHQLEQCSGRGSCDNKTGLCKCDPSWAGANCGRTECHNNCSDRGECLSLRGAADRNDGHTYNRTVAYTLWDADIFYGCKCDPGYVGDACDNCPGCEENTVAMKEKKVAEAQLEEATRVAATKANACGRKKHS